MPRTPWFPDCRSSLKRLGVVLAGAGLVLTLIMPTAEAAPKKRLMIVLDLSRSMSGPVSGAAARAPEQKKSDFDAVVVPRKARRISKINHVKKILARAYRDFSSRLDIGMVALAHSQPQSCSDIKTVLPMGPVNTPVYTDITRALTTVGEASPLTAALKKAAISANYLKTINTVLLITDSTDGCGQNICKLGLELRNSGANITVHVVAIGLSNPRQTNLRCLAGNTRGHFFNATTTQAITRAIYGVFNAAYITGHLTPEPPPDIDVLKAAETAAPIKLPDAGALALSRVPLPRRKPPVPRQPKPKDEGSTVTKMKKAPAVTDIAPGKKTPGKRVTKMLPKKPARTVAVNTRKPDPEATVMPRPVLDNQGLKASAMIVAGSAPLGAGVKWLVLDKNNKTVLSSTEARPLLRLPEGEYTLQVRLGSARASKQVTVSKGGIRPVNLVLNAGGLRVNAVVGGSRTIQADRVRFSLRSAPGQPPVSINHLPGNSIIHLNAGTYTIRSQYGNANAVVEADVVVQPGKLTEATLNHNAGKVVFKLSAPDRPREASATRWQIEKPDGTLVKVSEATSPSFILASGPYEVSVQQGGKAYRSSFEVQSGKNILVEISTK